MVVDFDIGEGLFQGILEFESRVFEMFALVAKLDINDFWHFQNIYNS